MRSFFCSDTLPFRPWKYTFSPSWNSAAHSELRRAFSTSPFALVTCRDDSPPRILYEPLEGIERLENYKPGGYHPVAIGHRFCDRYRIIHKLGHGAYSTTWLSRDEQTEKYAAIKIYNFNVQGLNGDHSCFVTIPARASLAGLKSESWIRLFHLDVARILTVQLAIAVAYVHAQGFVHGDLHLGNILLRTPPGIDQLPVESLYEEYGQPILDPIIHLDGKPLPPGVPSHAVVPVWLGKESEKITPSEARILLTDFGEAFSPSQVSRYQSCTPRSIRSPEAHFEPDKPFLFHQTYGH
ncbi:hypothetical protein AJ79_06568 [Helicocarpus griseus UAMH5409]|uniref:non-specific serine/threonine protein kinase n=1 Tax=Helicocarpus griseus UAMH5409 TaxID=1447875 RepID=A0A2B7XBG7_9EURO|nr:hypothetical protein AJ79_06568 [Helicocarpus griseus UAMH5409]